MGMSLIRCMSHVSALSFLLVLEEKSCILTYRELSIKLVFNWFNMEEERDLSSGLDEMLQYESDSLHESASCSNLGSYDFNNSSPAIKAYNPLEEQVVQQSLHRMNISGSQLINMSVKELNKCLIEFPVAIASKLKRCRRTLKNRGYAKNCRIKRIAAKNHLEQLNINLVAEIRDLRQRNKLLLEQLNQLPCASTMMVTRSQYPQQTTMFNYQAESVPRYECKREAPQAQQNIGHEAQQNLDDEYLMQTFQTEPSHILEWS